MNKKVPEALRCDNYLKNHHSSECPKDRDEATIAKNKLAHLGTKNRKIPKGLKCDNCLGNHYSSDFPMDRDEAAIEKNKTACLAKKAVVDHFPKPMFLRKGVLDKMEEVLKVEKKEVIMLEH